MKKSAFTTILLAGIFAAILISSQTVFAEPNLVNWWEFDEGSGSTAYDSAGGNNGTITGATWSNDPCRRMCLSFDGSNDYVALSSFTVSTNNGTIALWFKTDANFSGNYNLQGYLMSGSSQYADYLAVVNEGDACYAIAGETASQDDYFVYVKNAASKNQWNHIAVSFDNKTAKTYLNGDLIDTRSVTNSSLTLDRIGGRSTEFFNGEIDDVRFYNRALSAGEVMQLYQGGVVLTAYNPNPANRAVSVDPNTVLSWSAGPTAASHDMYLGTGYNSVDNANTSSPEYKGNFDVNTFDPCGLAFSTIYYWRIDEVNDSNVWKGGVWRFRTTGALSVPSEYSTIQAAIDASINGDTILVADGVYTWTGNRDIDFLGKAITVKSENGPENCIIDCDGSSGDNHRGFYFHSGEVQNSVLEGFTITDGYIVTMCMGGGGILINGASPTIKDCIIINNHAELEMGSLCYCHGGGICVGGTGNPLITDCVISYNSVDDWGVGGGIYCQSPQITLNNCLITNNTATGPYGDEFGGGICSIYSLIINNCTIANNTVAMGGCGGGIYYDTSTSDTRTITNSIIWGNSPDQICAYDITKILAAYSDIRGGWSGTGNINANPYFADPCNGDYHLKSQAGRWNPSSRHWVKDANASPCIDAGDPSSDWMAELWPHGKRINMGAYGGTPQASMSLSTVGNIANLDNDPCDIIDFNDLALFVGKWLHEEVLLPEDLDRNGIVNFVDYAIFAQQWLAGSL